MKMQARGKNPEKVIEALKGRRNLEDARSRGILFHGTCEKFPAENLSPGLYDQVLWSAETPCIAQSYIPACGLSMMHSRPPQWRLKDSIRPSRNPSLMTAYVMEVLGARSIDDLDVDWGADGLAVSWPSDIPRIQDFEDHIQRLGYEYNDQGVVEIKAESCFDGSGRFRIQPADWKLPGRLFVILPDEDFRIEKNPPWEQRSIRGYHRLEDFERFAGMGIHAFVMSDLLQSRIMGNLIHGSVGILPEGLRRLSWVAIDAVNFDSGDLDEWSRGETPEFTRFLESVRREKKCEAE